MPRCVYLLHFSRPWRRAQHYIGQTTRPDVGTRIAEHRAGRGSRLTRRVVRAGIALMLARTWEDAPRDLERTIKARGGARRLCPVCSATKARLIGDGCARMEDLTR